MRTMFSTNEILGKIIGREKQIIKQNHEVEKSQKIPFLKNEILTLLDKNFTFHLLMSDSDKKL